METFPNFGSGNSNDLDFTTAVFELTNGNRNSITVSSANLTSQPSHSFYGNMGNMLATPESTGSDAVCPETLILSPYNMLSGSPGHLNMEEADDTFYPFYIGMGMMSPHASPTLSPDASVNHHMNKRQNKKSKHQKSNNIKKSSFTSNDNVNNNDANGHNNMIQSIITSSPNNKLHNDQIIFSLLASPMLDNMATSTASREIMPNLNLGSNLVSDSTNTQNTLPNESSSPDKIAPITPSSLMEMKRKQPNSPKSGQNESKSHDRPQQLQPPSKDHSTFIAPTSPTQLNHIRTSTGPASPSSRKSIRSNQASSPLALGPSKSPHSLKPTISPNLKPKLPGVIADEVAEQLANKSNYRSILEGTAQSLGISYSSDVHSSLESRRTTHKAAEQKRRDSLKQSFDELKKVVPLSVLSIKNNSNDDGNNSKINGKSDGNKNVSKLFLLKRAHDHIVELEQKSKEKDELIQKLKVELDELRGTKRQKIEKEENGDNEKDTKVSEDEQQASLNI